MKTCFLLFFIIFILIFTLITGCGSKKTEEPTPFPSPSVSMEKTGEPEETPTAKLEETPEKEETKLPEPTQTPVIVVVTATPDPTPVVIVVTAVPDTSDNQEEVSEEYVEEALETLDALDALSAVIDVGSSPQDFKEHLLKSKIAVERFLADNPDDKIPGLNRELRDAMRGFETAGEKAKTWWAMKSKFGFSKEMPKVKTEALASLADARDHTKEAHNLVNKFR